MIQFDIPKIDNKELRGLDFHHLGLAVKYPEMARNFLTTLGYKIQNVSVNEIHNVNIQFCEHDYFPRIELVFKLNDDSNPINNILKNADSQIYHICYQCSNLKETIEKLKKEGNKLVCISVVKDFPFAFYYIKGIGLIEFYEMNF